MHAFGLTLRLSFRKVYSASRGSQSRRGGGRTCFRDKQSLAAREGPRPQGVQGSHLVPQVSDEEKWTQTDRVTQLGHAAGRRP